MKIKRVFGATKQVRPYEPVNSYCEAEIECEKGQEVETSKYLDEFVRSEVAKTLLSYAPQGASKEEKKERSLQEAELDIDYGKPPYKYPGTKPSWPTKPLAMGQETPATIDDVFGVGDERQTKNK